MPEQPPPTTRILRPHSGLPSSSRRSSIFLAAVSVNVIIRASLWRVSDCRGLEPPCHYNRGPATFRQAPVRAAPSRPQSLAQHHQRTPPAGSSVTSSSVALGSSAAII